MTGRTAACWRARKTTEAGADREQIIRAVIGKSRRNLQREGGEGQSTAAGIMTSEGFQARLVKTGEFVRPDPGGQRNQGSGLREY
ncbi:hypothetical protein AC629_08155 [Bradyrhizobium sp. NAS80.1]|nr:hypothetical protein AC629_08155 [Bradyrhizobium sp. NAS80.1]